jgi:AraC family transcriptional regulator, transcriptional activator FtrA
VRELLETTTLGIETIAHRTGFTSADNLRRRFRDRYGLTPSQYRNAFPTPSSHHEPG